MIKYTKVYRCPDNIGNLIIRIRLRDSKEDAEEEVRTFSWQEKVFGKFERDFYKDESNCVTDLDKKYHNDVAGLNECDEKLFSYVNEDGFSIPDDLQVSNVTGLARHMNNLFLSDDNETEEYDFGNSLQKSILEPGFQAQTEMMYIMADFGEYFENTWIKSEQVLTVLKYDSYRKTLSIYPDFTEGIPYEININTDTHKTYEYFIGNASESIPPELLSKDQLILNKLASFNRKLRNEDAFVCPQKNCLEVYLFFQILSGKNFEYSNIYVQYFIDLPDGWKCKNPDSLKGYTQACMAKGTQNEAYFGFPFEVVLEYNLQNLQEKEIPKPPCIYFEVISKDTWDRFRTEGLSYKSIPISQPGHHEFDLTCFRILAKNRLSKMRRFFIGDYSTCNDLTWLYMPKDYQHNVLSKFGVDTIGTGDLRVKLGIVHISQAFMSENPEDNMRYREKFLLEKLKSSHLIKSVEQVLEAFKRARKNMIEARKNV